MTPPLWLLMCLACFAVGFAVADRLQAKRMRTALVKQRQLLMSLNALMDWKDDTGPVIVKPKAERRQVTH